MSVAAIQNLCMGCMTYLDHPEDACPVCEWQQGMQNQPHQLVPGSVLAGKYMVGRSLGQGGFGITYIAWEMHQQRRVAIKEYYPGDYVTRGRDFYTVMPQDTADAAGVFAQGRDRFFSEAQNLSQFDADPNIVSVLDFFYENETAYIVMEFVEGQTMKQYLASLGQPMLLGDVLALLTPVIESLEHVHNAGLLHRDISPDNIMITNSGAAKLLDFGAARAFSLQGERSNTVNVKVGYAPKEQFQTHGEQGPWTDVYALAATIYHAVTGRSPVSTLDRWQGKDTLQRPSSLGIAITAAEEAVLLKGMAVEHKKRYQSVRQFYDALIAAQQGGRGPVSTDKVSQFFQSLSGQSGGMDKLRSVPKIQWALLLCGAGILFFVGAILTSNATTHQLGRYYGDSMYPGFYGPAVLSLACSVFHLAGMLQVKKGVLPDWYAKVRDPRNSFSFFLNIALVLLGCAMCRVVSDIVAILLAYGVLTTAGIYLGLTVVKELQNESR